MGLLRQDLPSSMRQVTETCRGQQGGRVPVGNGRLLAQYDLGRAPHPSGLSPLLSSGRPDCCEGGSVGSRNPPDTAFSKCLKWKLRWQHQDICGVWLSQGTCFLGASPRKGILQSGLQQSRPWNSLGSVRGRNGVLDDR